MFNSTELDFGGDVLAHSSLSNIFFAVVILDL